MLNLIQTSRTRALRVKDTHKSPKDKPGSRPLAVPEKPLQQFPIQAMSPGMLIGQRTPTVLNAEGAALPRCVWILDLNFA
jgi:hypothetical protein